MQVTICSSTARATIHLSGVASHEVLRPAQDAAQCSRSQGVPPHAKNFSTIRKAGNFSKERLSQYWRWVNSSIRWKPHRCSVAANEITESGSSIDSGSEGLKVVLQYSELSRIFLTDVFDDHYQR